MKKIALLLVMVTLCSVVAFAGGQSDSDASNLEVVFIPKLTGNMFFESANVGAQNIAKEAGFTCTYDGSPNASVADQVQIINSAVARGVDAIAISSLSPDGLNDALKKAMDKGIKVVTWDSDVDPAFREIYVNQGTPEILGKFLVDMAADQMTAAQKESAKFAFFYSSPTVPDQNAWVEYAKVYIGENYPGWELLTTEYGEQDAQKSLQIGQSILETYSDLDAILCPDSTALPGMAEAARKAGVTKNDIIITGFATPSSMREYIKDDTIEAFGLWDCGLQGAMGAYIGYWLASGNTFKVGDSISIPGIGDVKVEDNSIQGYVGAPSSTGIVLLPERVKFVKANIDDYNF
ncbi:MAG: autoinducer 2 ABC transporter substrate-binding protein LsrB [Spirochaetales bacterium]|nr:autoinducer 2 ABC transporter substrate-binding protein LsrB [Spirochaetales bacterium]